MAHFDAALKLQRPAAVGRAVALNDVAQVGDGGFGKITAEVDARVVEALFVRAAAEVRHVGDGAVGVDGDVFLDADGAEVARLRAEGLHDLVVGREAEAFVQFMVGAQEHEHDLRGHRFALLVHAVGGEHDALDALQEVEPKVLGDGFTLFLPRGSALFHRLGGSLAAVQNREGFSQLDVGGVVGFGGVGDDVFAGVGDHLEFVRAGAADRAGVGAHGAEHQPQAREDLLVRGVHRVVGLRRALFVTVERVRVLHREFAAAHHAEAGTALVAELRLDVIEVHGKLTPALDFLTRDVGDDLFRRRLDHEVAVVTVLDAQKLGTILLPTARFLPELRRLHDRHQEFHRARRVHFFADDRFDLADGAQPHRHVGVDAGGKLLDHAGADHVLLTHDVGIGRRFLERGKEKGTGAHSVSLRCVGLKAPRKILPGGAFEKSVYFSLQRTTMLSRWMSSGRSGIPKRASISSVWQPMMRRASALE